MNPKHEAFGSSSSLSEVKLERMIFDASALTHRQGFEHPAVGLLFSGERTLSLRDECKNNVKQGRIMEAIEKTVGIDDIKKCYLGKPLTATYDRTALFFNRITPRSKRNVIASLFYPVGQ